MNDNNIRAPLFIVMSGSSARRTERRNLPYPLNDAIEFAE